MNKHLKEESREENSVDFINRMLKICEESEFCVVTNNKTDEFNRTEDYINYALSELRCITLKLRDYTRYINRHHSK